MDAHINMCRPSPSTCTPPARGNRAVGWTACASRTQARHAPLHIRLSQACQAFVGGFVWGSQLTPRLRETAVSKRREPDARAGARQLLLPCQHACVWVDSAQAGAQQLQVCFGKGRATDQQVVMNEGKQRQ
eukprot:366113-Chlamydomonas_euryale.AAC.15